MSRDGSDRINGWDQWVISPTFTWHILGDRLIRETLLWVDRGILHVGPTKSLTFSPGDLSVVMYKWGNNWGEIIYWSDHHWSDHFLDIQVHPLNLGGVYDPIFVVPSYVSQ